MLPHALSLSAHPPSSILPKTHFCPKPLPSISKPIISTAHFVNPLKRPSSRHKLSVQPLKCSVSVVSEPARLESTSNDKPLPAEVSRTIMELSSVGTLSTLTQEGWPLGVGVRFAVDPEGTPIICLNDSMRNSFIDRRASLHVQLEQCGLRTPQCTIQGSLVKPEDGTTLKKLQMIWRKRFGEVLSEDSTYVVSVEQVIQIEDFAENGIWVMPSDYKLASPDPLRDFAETIVDEINTHNMDDVQRFCNIYVDLDFQVLESKMVWVDRLGFDMRLRSTRNDIYEVRIPFPREVTDVKGAKSSFNCMSQLAWEVEKNFHVPEFTKVRQLKKITKNDIETN